LEEKEKLIQTLTMQRDKQGRKKGSGSTGGDPEKEKNQRRMRKEEKGKRGHPPVTKKKVR